MLNLIPVANITLNFTEIEIEHVTTLDTQSDKEKVFAKFVLGNWIVFKENAEIIDGLLEQTVVDFCNKNFPHEALLNKHAKKLFLLTEVCCE